MLSRIAWDQLGQSARAVIEAQTGPVRSARAAAAGKNSHFAAFLDTSAGKVFVKGLRTTHPGVVTQRREAVINPFVRPISPSLLWQAANEDWSLLGFEHAPGRHANCAPGSSDLPKIVATMRQLAQKRCPDLEPLKQAEQRWAAYIGDGADVGLLAGDTLLHTDYNPNNILIHGPTARLIDWAWPTKGAAFIDPACFIVRLVLAGHSPADAEAVVAKLPAWEDAPRRSIDVFARALCRMWADIAQANPTPWKKQASTAAARWVDHRLN